MSAGSEFKKVLVRDNRLNVTDSIEFAVMKGAQNMTSFTANANTLSTSAHTWNIQVPSETTIFDRRVLWRSTFVLAVTGRAPVVGQPIIHYGFSDALCAFPLHQSTSVMTCVINNNSVSSNMRDILPALLKMNDIRELQRYNGYAPIMSDVVGKYSDFVGANYNPLGSATNFSDNDIIARGAWPIDGVATSLANAVAGTFSNTANLATVANTDQTFYVRVQSTEPLMVSPFLWSHPKANNQGMYGVQNMTFTFNIGDASRMWRSSTGRVTAVSIAQFTSSALIFNFLSPHPSDLLKSRNVVPYMDLPRFISTPGVSLPAAADAQSLGALTTITSNAIQLNQIPSRLFIWLRNPASYTTPYAAGQESYPDTFAVISGISVNFNNQSGILASATQQDLFKFSVENGSNQSWYEFSGQTNFPDVATGIGRRVPMSGSLLVLEFAKDINISDDYYAAGSLGNFQLQIVLQARNQFTAAYTPDFVIMVENDGCFVCERGTSAVYTGILTKSDVLAASEQPSYHYSDVQRMVGGGFLDSLRSIVGRVLPMLAPLAKRHLAKSGHPMGQAASAALGALGYGKSGGKLADRMV